MSPPTQQIADVANFGAFPGSGKDETKRIQACINTKARIIQISAPGVYLITLIELGNKQTLRCLPGVVLKLLDGYVRTRPPSGKWEDYICGITTKNEKIEWCAIDYVEYDGNAANNRDWGYTWRKWKPKEYDYVHAHGLFFGYGNFRIPPKRVYIGTAIIRNVVRNNLLWSGQTELVADNLYLTNSDADHLIYMSHKDDQPVHPAIIHKAVLAGHWRGAAVVSNAISFGTVIVRDIEVNPTIYDNHAIFMERKYGLYRSTYESVYVPDLDPAKLAYEYESGKFRAQIFWIVNPVTVNSIYVSQKSGTEKSNIKIDLVYTHARYGVCNDTVINNYKLDGVQSSFVLFRQQGFDKEWLKEQNISLPTLMNVCFRNGHVVYDAKSKGITSPALFNFNTNTKYFIVDGLNVAHGPDGYHRLMAQQPNWKMADLYFHSISMPNGVADIVADAQSGGVTISDSFFSSNYPGGSIICSNNQKVKTQNVILK